ncbi:MAG: hypothetical protein IKA17_02000 [Clostridia bacterium]|nr:hypothetical protein [Clostridia bacterium]
MGFFDKIKKTVIGEEMPEKPIMKITMLGARGVGKTSVLTSMYNNMNTAINDTRLHIVADSGTDSILHRKTDDLKKMFFEGNNINDEVQSGIAGDSTVSTFEFDFGMNTEKINMGLEIKDYPGEYVRLEPDTVKQYIEESNAILVAIDTPHLMECDGKYNEGKNYTTVITNFFKETLNSESSEKLIMLVPLKCEKYYHNGEIDAVKEKIKETYSELLAFLKDKNNTNGLNGKFACAITPILTVGEIVFDGFPESNGIIDEIEVNSGIVIPKKVNYKYLKAGATYSPEYCEQPLYYLLSFISKQYLKMKDEKESSGWIGKLKKMWALTPKINEMLIEIQKFSYKKMDNMDGYETCFGRGKV